MKGLPLDDAPKPRRGFLLFSILVTLSVASILFLSPPPSALTRTSGRDFQKLSISCPVQHSALAPEIPFSPRHSEHVYAKRLQGAVQIRTETFDGAPQEGNDEWYDKFYEFEAYLLETFPDVFAALKLEHFATHGLLLTWQGSDESLAPIVLMAHQDTVPVPEETVERWIHPPFAGHIDSQGWIWGRGVADCKNTLIGELSAVSELLHAGFSPTRTVLISFGFDEEGGGVHSARYIAQYLEEKYGPDSIFMIVDEGGEVMGDYFGQTWVAPATGEKGSVNIKLSVNVPGGHSSIPPRHTAIGILSTLVSAVEAHPPPVTLSPANPFATFAVCLAEYGTIDDELKAALDHERTWPIAAQIMADRSPGDAARLSTTQAVDIVHGGVKVNALPEEAYAIVNHRVAVDDSISRIQERYLKLLTPEAEKFNLSVVAFGDEPPAGVMRYLQLDTPGGVEASPVTPAHGDAWKVFAGTSLHLWPSAIVAPYLSTGGTDTRSYVRLTRAIYRFRGMLDSQRDNTHTVDERVHIKGHMSAMEWVHGFIQNADAFRA
ncbi:hypothetical protein K438DRAFT_1832892 [Mycena galopus ATCC 62051]|nr:hypothetical protein K438DRAFT_1832892 [Mycena galopus ATCC 62051]